jgi:hypothetical protein
VCGEETPINASTSSYSLNNTPKPKPGQRQRLQPQHWDQAPRIHGFIHGRTSGSAAIAFPLEMWRLAHEWSHWAMYRRLRLCLPNALLAMDGHKASINSGGNRPPSVY